MRGIGFELLKEKLRSYQLEAGRPMGAQMLRSAKDQLRYSA